jgi:hypothetical protein
VDIKHISGSGISDLQAKVVQGYRSVGIDGSLDTYTEDILNRFKRGFGENSLKSDFFWDRAF